MPFRHNWEQQGFYSKFWGEVEDKDIETKNIYFSNDPRSDKCEYQIIDGTEIETFDLSEAEITKIASNDIGMGFYLKNFAVVIISSNSEIRATFERYISICTRSEINWKFRICDTLDQAREWLKQLKAEKQKLLLQKKKEYSSRQPDTPKTSTQTRFSNK